MCFRKFIYAAALAVVGVLAAPPTAKASFLLKLESGSNSATLDLNALTNESGGSGGSGGSAYSYSFFYRETVEGTTTGVFTNLKFAGYTISADTNITNSPGSSKGGNLSLNGLTVSRDTGKSSQDDLTISLTATGYDKPSVQKSLDSNFGARMNTAASVVPTVDFRSSFAFGDVEFGDDVSNTATTQGSGFSALMPYSSTASTSLGANTGSYSLTDVVTITGLGFGRDNRLDQGGVSALVTPQLVPAPAGLILVAGAVPFLGLLRRRMRAAQPTQDVGSAA